MSAAIGFGPALSLRSRRGGAAFEFGGVLPAGAVLTRASAGAFVDVGGALGTAGNDVARFESDPPGLLIEPAATNVVRNAVLQGAAAGTPGTAPANWSLNNSASGIVRSITGVGAEAGVPCLDLRFAGTATAAVNLTATFDTLATLLPAAAGQAVALSVWLKLAAGSLNGVAAVLALTERDGGGAALASQSGPVTPGAAWSRAGFVATIANAGTSHAATPRLGLAVANGATIDCTIRIGLPQLEAGAGPTSPIATSGAAGSRAGDVVTLDWGAKGVPNGAATVRYTFDDGSAQDVATTIANGVAAVPANLWRARLRRAALV